MAETLRQIRSQCAELFGQMQPHQRITFVALALMVMVPFGWLVFGSRETGNTPLQWGAAFDREMLMVAEQALVDRGFNDFRTVGQRIYAPQSKVDEYNAALASAGVMSPQAPSEMQKMLESFSPFTPRDQRESQLELARQIEANRILSSMSGVREANVIWARSDQRSRHPGTPAVTATVFVTPVAGSGVEHELVNGLRSAVANMIPDLRPDHVVVVDRSTGTTFENNDVNNEFTDKLARLRRSIVQRKEQELQRYLTAIVPNVRVAVNMEFDNIRSSRERSQKIDKQTVELTTEEQSRTLASTEGPVANPPGTASNQPRDLNRGNGQQATSNETDRVTRTYAAPSLTVTETEYDSATPQSIQVSVSVPKDHIEQIVLKQGAVPGTTPEEKAEFTKLVVAEEERLKTDITALVRNQIPPDSPVEAVSVVTYTRIPQEVPPANIPMTEVLRDFGMTWGSSAALAVFALWALLMLKKSMPVSQSAPSVEVLDKLAEAARPRAPEKSDDDEGPRTPREHLKHDVEHDPAAAAVVLSKWLDKV